MPWKVPAAMEKERELSMSSLLDCKVGLKRTMEPGVGRQAIVNESHFHGFLLTRAERADE
jgi:hypothetical protein